MLGESQVFKSGKLPGVLDHRPDFPVLPAGLARKWAEGGRARLYYLLLLVIGALMCTLAAPVESTARECEEVKKLAMLLRPLVNKESGSWYFFDNSTDVAKAIKALPPHKILSSCRGLFTNEYRRKVTGFGGIVETMIYNAHFLYISEAGDVCDSVLFTSYPEKMCQSSMFVLYEKASAKFLQEEHKQESSVGGHVVIVFKNKKYTP
jgi:hypothetical protein